MPAVCAFPGSVVNEVKRDRPCSAALLGGSSRHGISGFGRDAGHVSSQDRTMLMFEIVTIEDT